MYNRLLNKIMNIVRRGRVANAGGDDKQFPVQQIEYLGKTADAIMHFPYGHHANVPADAFALILSVQGDKFALASDLKKRPKLAAGEVAYYHPPTGAFLIFRASGDLDIETGDSGGAKVNVDASQVNLGEGGQPIARMGDTVQVTVTGGSSAGTYNGTITSGGGNTSI